MKEDVYNELEKASMPQISIVIPVYNNFELTKNCIDSINNAELKTGYEIIVADDGSTDETLNLEKYYNNVRLIKTPENMGFLLNVKNAVQHAKGSYIFLMNNDMIAKQGFLDYLYNTINNNRQIGVVGAMMLNEDETIQEVGGTVYINGSSECNYAGQEQIDTSELYDADYCSGCGIMFSKEDWDKLGGFDERFVPAYYEDTDLCFQIKYILGKKVVCQPKAQIYHFHSKTYNEKASAIIDKNRAKFLEKWKDKLYKKRIFKYNGFLERIFSIKKIGYHKVITILGIRLKFK